MITITTFPPVPVVDPDNYYNKEEVELLIADGVSSGAIDLSNYYNKLETYSKAQVDALVSANEADLSDYYTKAEVESLIANNDVDLSNYYNRTEVDTKLGTKVDKVANASLVADSKIISYDSHIASASNPHNTTASQVGAYSKTQTDTLLSNKVDKEAGKGLSTNDFTDAFKQALETNSVQDITANSVTKKLVVAYTDGTSVDLSLDDVVTTTNTLYMDCGGASSLETSMLDLGSASTI